MKKITLILCLICIAPFMGNAQKALTLADAENLQVGSVQILSESSKEAISNQRGSALTTFSDRADFITNCPLANDLISEDFTGGPTAFLACGTSISSAGDVCFPAGVIEEGLEITSSGADAGNTTVYVDPIDGFGNTIPLVGSITFADFTIINFSTPDPVTSFGFDLFSLATGSNVDIRVIGASGSIGTFTVDVTSTGPTFVGVIADEPVLSVELEDLTGVNVELLGDLIFGACVPDAEPFTECGPVPVDILDLLTVTSAAPVAESGIIGTDFEIDNVDIDITHTWTGDLTISLISPTAVSYTHLTLPTIYSV